MRVQTSKRIATGLAIIEAVTGVVEMCQGSGIGSRENSLRCFRHSHGGTGCGSAYKAFRASQFSQENLRRRKWWPQRSIDFSLVEF
jgi:hypothetical protein